MVFFTLGFTNDLQQGVLIVVNLLFNRWLFGIDAKFPIFGNEIGASRTGRYDRRWFKIKFNRW